MSLEIMFDVHPVRKQAFLDEKTSILHSGHTGIFKGANHWFWSKIGKISSQFDFGQMSLEIMFEDHPIRKQAFLVYTNIDFIQWTHWDFLKGLTHDFGGRLEISYLLVFGQK